MRRLAGFLAVILLGWLPRGLAAQGECTVLDNRSVNATNRGTPQEVFYVVGADISCPGGKRIFADNATIFTATGVVDLRGNVRFSDPERALASDQAQYDRINQRLYASGNVRVRALASNSILYSDVLTYEQATATREARMLAQPGARRPHAVLRGTREGGPRPGRARASADSTVVDADMIEVLGERFFHAVGNAVMTRDSLRATGGVIDYGTDTGRLLVVNSARVDGPRYQLLGDTVRAEVSGDTLRSVHARRSARLITEEVRVEAPLIDIELQEGLVQRMVAVLLPARAPDDPTRARIDARSFRLAADSIEVRAPAQQLEEVIAVGRAFGEMVDTLPPLELPEDAAGTLANDWLRGDTLHAYFVANPKAARDTAAEERVLERITAGGAPAAALYRKRPQLAAAAAATDSVTAAGPEIGYLLANLIEIRMTDGEVSDVQAQGEVRGMYLQPRSGATAAAGRREDSGP